MDRETDTHIFFWGGFLSNWQPSQFKYKGLTFFTSEQAFMWEKALFFHDMEAAAQIMKTPEPSTCKKIGRKVKNFQADQWMKKAYQVMVDVNYEKFKQGHFRLRLLDTYPKTLVEASPEDRIWGIGLHSSDDRVLSENNWKGQNLLGKALMEVRERLRNESLYKT